MSYLDRPEWRVWLQMRAGYQVAFCGTYYECRDYALGQTAHFRIEKVKP